MVITIIVFVWLLASAWFTVWGLGKDLGFTRLASWLSLIHSCLFAPIIILIIRPIKDILRERKIRKKFK
jgi:hypothetical protein